MYNVQVDENLFYTGSYAKVGTVKNGVNVDKLPPTENALCYKLVDTEVTNTYEQPIVQYITETISDSEFDTYYFLESTDEEGNEIQSSLTEEEYNALSEEEQANVTVTKIPKTITVELTAEEFAALSEEERQNVVVSYKTDSDGNVVYETIEETVTVKDWEFSQDKYDEIETLKTQKETEAAEAAAYQESISNETLKAENAALTEQVDMLTSCLLEMSEIIYA